jgi:toxin ParE1/3/4
MKIVWAETAYRDLLAIRSYIAEDSEESAVAVVSRLIAAAASLAEMSNRGRQVIWRPDIRQLVVGSYLIFYRVAGEAVGIGRVLHGSRDVRAALRRFPRVP